MFAEKLDFLMNLTNTQASALGRACLLNASHVSRLRTGARPLPKKPVFLRDMSAYLARHVTADYQRTALCGRLKLPVWPDDEKEAAGVIERWLTGQEEPLPDISPLLASFSAPPSSQTVRAETDRELPKARSYYYGAEGKREAVLQFFSFIEREKQPQTLLLSSEEEMGWLYEDPVFAARWAREFQQILMAGNRVKIIHSIGRNMNEMLEAVAKWIPIYMTGLIEPYYYPKLRDGILQRTLFLAPRTAAVTSLSVDRKTDGMLNELITDREAVAALTAEYERYFSLCRPLMHILTPPKREELWWARGALIRSDGALVSVSDLPTLSTMPRWVAESMQKRAPESGILSQWEVMSELLTSPRAGAGYTEILPEEFPAEPPALSSGDLLGAPGLRYTQEEWQAHVESVSKAAKGQEGYVQLRRPNVMQNVCLLVREGRGVILTKTASPGVAFAISETTMVNAFWGYLNRMM